MDVIYSLGEATAHQVLSAMADAPSHTAVRTFLRILEDKGHLSHDKKGREFVYRPTRTADRAAKGALRRVLDVFYGGSLERAVAAHLSRPDAAISDEELRRLASLIRQARGKGNLP